MGAACAVPKAPWQASCVCVASARNTALASSWLFVCSLSQSLCSNISLQAKNQMFLDYFAGDFAAHARVMTTLSSVSAMMIRSS